MKKYPGSTVPCISLIVASLLPLLDMNGLGRERKFQAGFCKQPEDLQIHAGLGPEDIRIFADDSA